jgi:hypothetical protein
MLANGMRPAVTSHGNAREKQRDLSHPLSRAIVAAVKPKSLLHPKEYRS